MTIAAAKARNVQARWDGLMRKIEAPFAVDVLKEKNRYIEEESASFPATRQLGERAFDLHLATMKAICAHYEDIAIKVGLNEMRDGLKALPGLYERKDRWDQLYFLLVRMWAEQWGRARATAIAGTTREDMQAIISAALAPDAEFNPVQVAARLLRARELSAYRAKTIAQTETHAAMMFASFEGAAQLGRDEGLELVKTWMPVVDGRTRDAHAAMSSHPPIAMDALFDVGGEKMSRPGDPRGSAANTIRCRCVLSYKPKEE